MKVIIVDDEIIERKAMRKLISDSFTHIEVVAEAANGRIAIEEAKRHRPDVMFMDIHMPGIDGLEAIRHISAELPQTKFIMVSAYDSFEYAKQAMKQGVKEYILKPSNKQETLESLLRLEKEITQERMQVEQTEKLTKQQILNAILQNEITKDIDALYQKLFPDAHTSYFFVITGSDLQAISTLLTEKTYLAKEQGDKLIVMLLSDKKSLHHVKADALTLARYLCQSQPAATIGIGLPNSELTKLSISYQQALLASTQLTEEGSVPYGFPLLQGNEDNTVRKLEKAILEAITNGRLEQATDYFILYHEHLTKQEKSVQYLREWALQVKHALEDKGVSLRETNVLEAETKTDFIELIRYFTEKMILQGEGNDPISKAKTYIHDHYRESFSLEDVADYVELTPTYFTKLFKDQTQQTFIDYVTDYRIEKSKELLRQTNLSLKEIAYEVGYKDPNYYSRVFKKWTNLSPKQFRSTLK